jgi:UrcA family protein
MNANNFPTHRSDSPFGKLALMGLCALILVSAIARQQARADDTHRMTVSTAGLDLSTVEGRRAARERVFQAARRVCLEAEDMDDLSHHENYLACVDASLTAALEQLRLPEAAAVARNDHP